MVKSPQFEIHESEIGEEVAPEHIEREKLVVLLDKAQRSWNQRYNLSTDTLAFLNKSALRKLAKKLLPRYTARAYCDILYLTHGAAAMTLKNLIPTFNSHQVFSYIENVWVKAPPAAPGAQPLPTQASNRSQKKKKKKNKDDFVITALTGDYSFMNSWLSNEVKKINWDTLVDAGELGISTAFSLNLHGTETKYQLSDYGAAAGINSHLFDFGKGVLGLMAMRQHDTVKTMIKNLRVNKETKRRIAFSSSHEEIRAEGKKLFISFLKKKDHSENTVLMTFGNIFGEFYTACVNNTSKETEKNNDKEDS